MPSSSRRFEKSWVKRTLRPTSFMIWGTYKEMTSSFFWFLPGFLRRLGRNLAGLVVLRYVYIAYQRFHHRRKSELFRVVSENAADLIALVARAWHLLFHSDPPLTMTINVSPRQFAQSNLVADVKSDLDETKVDPRSVQLEITETTAMSDPNTTIRICSQLKDLGVQLSIDDFGTGHSSLSRLHSLPVDVLKIDRSFIRGIEQAGESREIARLIVTLAHHMDLKVVAEGIETRSQLTSLEQFGCEFGQGYLFSRPVDHAALEKLLSFASCDPAGSTVT